MNNEPPVSPDTRSGKIPASWWISVLLALGVLAVYWPVFGYGFVEYDDQKYILENPQVKTGLSWDGLVWAFTTFFAGNWHPLTWLSYMLDTQLFGFHPQAYHTINVLLHAANTVLLFWLLKRMTGALWRSAFVAALFGFHPLHVESVAWIAERKDVLSTFFFMLTLMAYIRYAQGRSRAEGREPSALNSGGASVPVSRLVSSLAPPGYSPAGPDLAGNSPTLNSQPSTLNYTLALFFFALGLMSKPMLVTIPFVLLLLDFWPLKRLFTDDLQNSNTRPLPSRVTRHSSLLLEKLPFFALSAAACVVTFLAQRYGESVVSDNVITIADRLQNAAVSYWVYLEKMLWPSPLAVFYPYPPIPSDAAMMAVFMLLVISAAVFLAPWRRPYLTVGWLWYLGMLVPVIGLVQVGAQAMADRYTYLPLIGVFIAFTWGTAEILSAWWNRRILLTIVAVAVLGACLTLTAMQVGYWRNSETLARHALTVTADNAPMQVVLGRALLNQGKVDEAAQHFAEAMKIMSDDISAQGDMAATLLAQGRFKEAVENCRVALKSHPHDPKLHYILGNALLEQGQWAEAIVECQTTLQIDPTHSLAMNDLAWLLATVPDARLRNGAEAVKLGEQACRLTNYKMTLFVGTLAAAYAEAGRFDDAVKTANQAIALATAGGQPALAARNGELLKLYQAHQAYHQPAHP